MLEYTNECSMRDAIKPMIRSRHGRELRSRALSLATFFRILGELERLSRMINVDCV